MIHLFDKTCFITKNWEIASILLDFPQLEGQHTGKNMAQLLAKRLIELDLVDKVGLDFDYPRKHADWFGIVVQCISC